jgi:hypothetical protein
VPDPQHERVFAFLLQCAWNPAFESGRSFGASWRCGFFETGFLDLIFEKVPLGECIWTSAVLRA